MPVVSVSWKSAVLGVPVKLRRKGWLALSVAFVFQVAPPSVDSATISCVFAVLIEAPGAAP